LIIKVKIFEFPMSHRLKTDDPSGMDVIGNIWVGKPVAVPLEEVSHIMKGMFSTGSSRIRTDEQDENYREYDSTQAAREVDTVLGEWEKGHLPPLTEERCEQMIEQNNRAHAEFMDLQHPDNLTEEFITQAEQNLMWRNDQVWDGYRDYMERVKDDATGVSFVGPSYKKRKEREDEV